MRSLILIAYDIADDKRRNKIFQKLKGYGRPLQYSLFCCKLTASERQRLRSELWPCLDHRADRLVWVDLGPVHGRVAAALECWGQPLSDDHDNASSIII